VAITQIVQHNSLDEEYKGILAALEEAGYEDGKTIKIVFENAQGDLKTANLIANKFEGLKPKAIVAISTPSARALLNVSKKAEIPLVFTAVTDPEAILGTPMDKRDDPITGISDALLAGPQVDLICKIIPEVKSIGVVYNPGEPNSVKAIQQFKAAADERGIIVHDATADKSSDIITATTGLVGHVDAIYVPNDNTAVSTIEAIVSIGKNNKIPVFAGDIGSVERGAIAAQAYDRIALGREAGQLVVKILQGQKAGDLKIGRDHPLILMINPKSAQAMGVTIPKDLMGKAKIIGDKS
jgi:putative ABC transport system substrate-binding protein